MNGPAIRVRDLEKRYRVWAHAAPTNLKERLRMLGKTLEARAGLGDPAELRQDVWALRGVSFDVARGEVLGVIGRNGAGKSTLLSILARVTEPSAGFAELHGRVSSLLEVGTGFHPELSGRDNVFLNGAVLGMSRSETARKFDEIVDFAGVREFIEIPVKRYSSGMQVRLAFAVAAHLDPEILLLDEVLAVGDQEFQTRCLARVQSMISSGRTVLFVSHDLTAVSRLCPRAILIDDGRIAFEGKADDTIERYLTSNEDHAPQREGSGEIRLRRLRLGGLDGSAKVESGAPARLEVELDASAARPGDRYDVSTAIQTPARETVVELSTRLVVPADRQSILLTCEIEALPLRGGPYVLGGLVRRGDDVVDRWDNAAEVTLYGPTRQRGLVVLSHQWHSAERQPSATA